jgi:hypothetical protein
MEIKVQCTTNKEFLKYWDCDILDDKFFLKKKYWDVNILDRLESTMFNLRNSWSRTWACDNTMESKSK